MGQHQIELHLDSRQIKTFSAAGGFFRYKKKTLLFGVNMAPEKFHQIMS